MIEVVAEGSLWTPYNQERDRGAMEMVKDKRGFGPHDLGSSAMGVAKDQQDRVPRSGPLTRSCQ
jgi:hypothetical protein